MRATGPRPMHAGNIAPEDVWEPSEEYLLGLKTFESRLHLVLPSRRAALATQTVYDSITASSIPANAAVAAGYVTGNYVWSATDWARFSGDTVGIDVWAEDAGTAEDCEQGNAQPSAMPGWVLKRRAAGVDPTVYCGQNTWWQQIIEAFESAGVAQPHYWVANYNGSTAIPAGAIGHQYADGAYDTSSFVYPWPGVQAAPAPTPTANAEEAMYQKLVYDAANKQQHYGLLVVNTQNQATLYHRFYDEASGTMSPSSVVVTGLNGAAGLDGLISQSGGQLDFFGEYLDITNGTGAHAWASLPMAVGTTPAFSTQSI